MRALPTPASPGNLSVSTSRNPSADHPSKLGKRLPLRILVVQREEERGVTMHILGELSYAVELVGDGRHALAALQTSRYDVVLIDLSLPGDDGLAVTEAIRQDPKILAQPHIILMTAAPWTAIHERARAAGIDDYLEKPLRLDELASLFTDTQTARPHTTAASRSRLRAAHSKDVVIDDMALSELKAMLGPRAETRLPTLLASFYPTAERLLADARTAAREGNADSLRRAAHSLKSNAATFGALRLATAALDLERRARSCRMDGAEELIRNAEAEFARARAALSARYPQTE